MASSASNLYGGATSAPPPTPSAHSTTTTSTTTDAADAFSRLLLHRLPPPSLSLPSRRSSSPPLISLSADEPLSDDLLSSISQLGFFQLTHHSLPPQLANSAESDSLSLFHLPKHLKLSLLPQNHWPLGYHCDDDEDDDAQGESFRLDGSCSTESTELCLGSLREFTRALERLGVEIVDLLAKAVGFENPVRDDPARVCSIMWISEECEKENGVKRVVSGGFYPFIVGLRYQMRRQKLSLLSDSGWVSVLPQLDSVLVTIGDIAQVWSNGRLKKVRGRPVAELGEKNDGSRSISMTLLLSLPTESRVAPILPKPKEEEDKGKKEEDGEIEGKRGVFQSFDFEDYAWRVYHERSLLFKDPLDRYRITQT